MWSWSPDPSGRGLSGGAGRVLVAGLVGWGGCAGAPPEPAPRPLLPFQVRWSEADTHYVVFTLASSQDFRYRPHHRVPDHFVLEADRATGVSVVRQVGGQRIVVVDADGSARVTTAAGTEPLPAYAGGFLRALSGGLVDASLEAAVPPGADPPPRGSWYRVRFDDASIEEPTVFAQPNEWGGDLERLMAVRLGEDEPLVFGPWRAHASVVYVRHDVPLDPAWASPALGVGVPLPEEVQLDLGDPRIGSRVRGPLPYHERLGRHPLRWVGMASGGGEAWVASARDPGGNWYDTRCAIGEAWRGRQRGRWVLDGGLPEALSRGGPAEVVFRLLAAGDESEGCVTVTASLRDAAGAALVAETERKYCGVRPVEERWSLPFDARAATGELTLELDVRAVGTCSEFGSDARWWVNPFEGPYVREADGPAR